MSRSLTYYKSKLKHAEKSGPQWVTIEVAKVFCDDKGNDLKRNGNQGYVVRYKNENIEHEELYWTTAKSFDILLKMINMIKCLSRKENSFTWESKDLIGKQLWIVIRHNVTMNGDVEVKRESEIVHYSADEKIPNYPSVFEQYDIAAV